MKTPREVLLKRHQGAERKLDLLRQEAISTMLLTAEREIAQRAGKARPLLNRLWITAWEELVRPSRYAWAGMAAAWLALIVVNGTLKEPRRVSERYSSADKAAVVQSFIEERKLLAELLQAEGKPARVPPEPAPSPRSEIPIAEPRRLI
jgi:hypothetical protein